MRAKRFFSIGSCLASRGRIGSHGRSYNGRYFDLKEANRSRGKYASEPSTKTTARSRARGEWKSCSW